MQQKNEVNQRLSKRQDSILVTLFAHGELKLREVKKIGGFEVSRDTLRADLKEMSDVGVVEISEETVGGEANDAFVYSLSERGSEHAYAIQVSNNEKSIQRRLDDIERELADLRTANSRLKQEKEELLENQEVLKQDIQRLRDYFEHYLDQFTYSLEKLGHPVVEYFDEDEK